MVGLVKLAKNHLSQLPYPVGNFASSIPYSIRPGLAKSYNNGRQEIEKFRDLDDNSIEQNKLIFDHLKKVVTYAYGKIPFYKELYNSAGINPVDLQTLSEFSYLPVISKSDLQAVDLEFRSAPNAGRELVNTGGSSGNTLEFYIPNSAAGHEWAHMHNIWANLGFQQNMLRVVFAGRSDIKGGIVYDSIRHQFNVDVYAGWDKIADILLSVYDTYELKFFHGYPSAIFDFILWLQDNNHPLLSVLQSRLTGIFLGSEFPNPSTRERVESLLGCKAVSWYGHTERAVLAPEQTPYNYKPFKSYGFAEAVDTQAGYQLIGTAYHNLASPLIRYNTGDYIKPHFNDRGILETFKVEKGRNSEFIFDKNNSKIFLTALIFGRHHKIFNIANHVQIQQNQEGFATIYVTIRDGLSVNDWNEYFDQSNVKITFDFKVIQEPFRTKSGKVPLLIRELN